MDISDQKNFFLQKGYLHIKNFFQENELEKISKISQKILQKAQTGKWDYIRVYRDYPNFFGKINLFGIDYPLNHSLESNTFDEIQKLNYKEYLLDILGWKNFNTPLIRLHTNSSFYNYQGEWHRDDLNYPSPNSVQIIIYLLDEEGYRIVPKDKNHLLVNYSIEMNKEKNVFGEFSELSKNIYDIIKVKRGDIFIHESGLLHQGFCKKKRLHYHLRHIKRENIGNLNAEDQFNFSDKFLKEFDLSKLENQNKYNYKNFNFIEKLKKLKTFILYFFPRLRSLKNNLFNKEKQSIFHSTFWQ